ncbi:C4b-binding protein alpha chain-like [Lepisosteus oculatus]|uniref:C4b-binding protein alpha chain-like n=1 Tax=Lepisosteus oculatus TaxID=7918 RepID=UPI003724088E
MCACSPVFCAFKLCLLLWLCSKEVRGQCDRPPHVPLATLSEESGSLNDFPEGITVIYVCNPGYSQRGGWPEIICSKKSWTSLTLRCEPKSCGSPGEIVNGRYHLPKGVLFGSHAIASCVEGYVLVGRKTRECLAGAWSSNIPVCEIIKCPSPPEIENGEILSFFSGDVKYGDVIQYKCNKFHLIGEKEIYCTKDGNYSGPPPKCKDITCKTPTVHDGKKVYGRLPPYKYKDIVSFTCNYGYKLIGSSTITCEEHGWLPKIPWCIKNKEVTTTTPSPDKPCDLWCRIQNFVFSWL